MWFDKSDDKSVLMDYDVYNESYGYDENYSESSTEFFVTPSIIAVGDGFSFAQESIVTAIIRKLKS